MDKEERMYYLGLSKGTGAVLGIVGGIAAGTYTIIANQYEFYANVNDPHLINGTHALIKGLLGGYILGFTIPMAGMLHTRIVDKDWGDMKERARNMKRIFTLDDKV